MASVGTLERPRCGRISLSSVTTNEVHQQLGRMWADERGGSTYNSQVEILLRMLLLERHGHDRSTEGNADKLCVG